MEIFLSFLLGFLALFYILQPLWAGASASRRQTRFEGWHSLEQLEIDRQLGKIDDAEFEELKDRVPAAPAVSQNWLESLIASTRVESLIARARRQKRVQMSLESEILIARARKRSASKLNVGGSAAE